MLNRVFGLRVPEVGATIGCHPAVTLKAVSGTDVNIVQEGIPNASPAEACYLGWQDSLRNLASLVEPEINQ